MINLKSKAHNRGLIAAKLLKEVAYDIKNNKGDNGGVFLDDELQRKILEWRDGK